MGGWLGSRSAPTGPRPGAYLRVARRTFARCASVCSRERERSNGKACAPSEALGRRQRERGGEGVERGEIAGVEGKGGARRRRGAAMRGSKASQEDNKRAAGSLCASRRDGELCRRWKPDARGFRAGEGAGRLARARPRSGQRPQAAPAGSPAPLRSLRALRMMRKAPERRAGREKSLERTRSGAPSVQRPQGHGRSEPA